ncbi:aldehyde ferredoxin oxidoreductase family protein [Desulfonatronovibrio hydrogenovorans]|uniref:aldehyde ferredoxin oxidoreductase family protein n=1 Tax=Desulfonatronovibrio hydrogenovorans TaxID=53245 RepID=UPI00048A668F|nr:aldehyde ferredoxin oxidoreductase C-terminal domain-containing protein [Desulfonatronovibrio hydrogenovorans]
MARLLRINTRTKKVTEDTLAGDYAGLGGRGLTSRIVRKEVPPTCHPLSAANKLIVAPGLLTGTTAANTGRLSVGGKSPLTGTIKESNAGGTFSQKLARLDIMGLVLEDKPDPDAAFQVIFISKNGVQLTEVPEISGLGTYDASTKLFEKFGSKVGIMVIGPAGENSRLASSIQFTDPKGNPSRAAGRGGLGALMGSKKIKAIVIDSQDAKAPEVADKEAFKAAAKRWAEILVSHPVTGQGLPSYGTSILINIINEAGTLPTKNFRDGRFDKAADISGEKMVELINQRKGVAKEGCHAGCVIQCSQKYCDENGQYLTSGFEYETVWAFGSNLLISNMDHIAHLDRLCDDLGLDTIETGTTVAMAMEAGVIPWGDGLAAIDLLKRIYDPKDYLGAIIGNGTAFTAEAFGVDRVPVVKKQSLPAYDPRAAKGVGVTYATTPMGADHTAGYAICQNILKVGGDIDPLGKQGNVEVSKNLQIATAAVDATGFCLFVAFAVLDTDDALDTIAKLISSRFGISFTADDIGKTGIEILKDEYSFNRDAGFTKAHDQLPDFFIQEELPPHKVKWDFTVDELQKAKVEI